MKKQLYWILTAGVLLVIGLASRTAVSAQPANEPEAPEGVGITAVAIESGFTQPVDIASAGDDRLFIVEQPGVIRIIDADGNTLPDPFLDINGIVDSETHNERGLLGLAFHPDYPNTPYFYVNYTAVSGSGDTLIVRYTVSNDPNVAEPNSAVEILRIDQPAGNHNAGDLAFGPDGYLYIPTGDGGSGGDPWGDDGNGQNRQSLLGKILRIDVDGGSPYAIPADNPFIGDASTLDEIWALGVRNPWRISFDRDTGDLYVADVGQGEWEEVNFQSASSTGGENYGWRCYEGNATFNTANCDDISTYQFPFDDYPHDAFPFEHEIDEGNSITGGFVYRGNDFPALAGIYIYADFISGNFWLAQNSGSWNITPLDANNIGVSNPSTFGEGCDGELYVASHSGTIYQIQASGGARPAGAALDQFVYLPLVMGGNGSGLTCSG
ncbi:PQQ-dependent sugar dehydrogenase [Candidatus Leptofilum sp.]|uniref:PQQ-dependent sugar dehydrogenase n=1 Tax=Candidatus Leptofilum sp. TaxID=3241576 RepID=UPI003B5B7296